jgi:hypothetical protein
MPKEKGAWRMQDVKPKRAAILKAEWAISLYVGLSQGV